MNYFFKQSFHLKLSPSRPGKTFKRGLNDVPEEYEVAPYFLKLVSLGLVVEPDKVSTAKKTDKKKVEALLEKLIKKSRAKKPDPEAEEKRSTPPAPLTDAQKAVEAKAKAERKADAADEKVPDKKAKGS